MTASKIRTAGVRTEVGAPVEIDQDYIRAKIAEAHRLRAETLAAMVRSLFARRPAPERQERQERDRPLGAPRSA